MSTKKPFRKFLFYLLTNFDKYASINAEDKMFEDDLVNFENENEICAVDEVWKRYNDVTAKYKEDEITYYEYLSALEEMNAKVLELSYLTKSHNDFTQEQISYINKNIKLLQKELNKKLSKFYGPLND